MPSYQAPLRDMQFLYEELFNAADLEALPGYEEFSSDLLMAVLEENARFCEEQLQPLMRSGDEEGCQFNDGVVTTPKGWKDAYKAHVEAGWPSIGADPKYGGQGLPKTISGLIEEITSSANMAFGMYPGLTAGAYNAIEKSASDEIKDLYLPKLASGEWTGTMCLTEPHCGTDLGLIRTKADPQSDGSYRLDGTKIFISSGDHDLADNIIHLVLARLPDAPEGIKGISLFVVPKFSPTADGGVGDANGVTCGAIEEKMGIHGSSTCVMNFDQAQGWLVGTPHKGMKAMFVMMNQARMAVAMQGLGVAEVAYQNAVAYTRERIQGRALKVPAKPEQAADPIIVHPDVRRMLMTMKALTEGNRAVGVWVTRYLDIANHSTDPVAKQKAEDFTALMTPIVKAFFTDCATDVANMAMQCFGGHGYVREWGMEQFVRDARITQIYEGTNGIQALDLVGRKMPQNMGRNLRPFFHEVSGYLEEVAATENEVLQPLVAGLLKSFGRLQTVTGWIAQQGLKNPDEGAAAATDFLRMFALVAAGYQWLRMAQMAHEKLGEDSSGFYQAKCDTAAFYFARILPQTGSLMSAIMSGAGSVMAMDDAQF